MLRPHRRIAALLMVIAILAGCRSLSVEEPATPTPIPTPIVPDKPTYVVQKGEVINQIEFSGRISAVEEMNLFFKTSGFVKRALFKRGDLVKAGDLIAELEIDDLLKEMAQAQVALNSAQLRLDEAENNLERQTAQAELDLAAAQARLTQAENANTDGIVQAELAVSIAQEQLARVQARRPDLDAGILAANISLEQAEQTLTDAQTEYQKAVDRPWEPDEVLESYTRQLRQAEWDHDLAQAGYDQAQAALQVYQHDLKIQELFLAQAESDLAQLQRGIDPQLAIDVQRVQQELDRLEEGVDPVLVNEVSQARLTLERLQAQVAEAQLVAPFDGQLLSISLRPGRAVEAFVPVAIVVDPDEIEVSADLSSSQLEKLVEGQEATITLSAYPGQEWRGTIRRLPFPYGSGGGTATLDEADTSTRVTLEGDLSELELGDLARVRVVLEEKTDALWLPPEAVRTFQGRKFVVVQDEERQRRVDVRLGIESQERVEILEGLEEGQVIIGQ